MNFDYASIDSRLEKLVKVSRQDLEKIPESHGWPHSSDVMDYCVEIGKEEGADLSILLAAALLHDVGFLYGGKSKYHSKIGGEECVPYLEKAGYESHEIKRIQHCIKAHNVRYEGIEPETIEAKVLIDADTLDKMDEGSYERAYKYMEEHKMSEQEFARGRVESRKRLLKEGKLWYTETGRKLIEPLVKKYLKYWKNKM